MAEILPNPYYDYASIVNRLMDAGKAQRMLAKRTALEDNNNQFVLTPSMPGPMAYYEIPAGSYYDTVVGIDDFSETAIPSSIGHRSVNLHPRAMQERAGITGEDNPFRRAQRMLASWGWVKGCYMRSDGAMCISGALRNSLSASDWMSAVSALGGLLGLQADDAVTDSGLVHWNDQVERTQEDVCRLLDLAAHSWDTEHEGRVRP